MDDESPLGMSRWSITAETAPGVSMDAVILSSILDALVNDPLVIMPGVACNVQQSTITAGFHVEASLPDAATDAAIQAFQRALATAGVDVGCRIADVSPD